MDNLGKGSKYKGGTSASVNGLGLIEQDGFTSGMPLRKETNEMEQRPKGEDKSVKSDRGTFKSKC